MTRIVWSSDRHLAIAIHLCRMFMTGSHRHGHIKHHRDCRRYWRKRGTR